MDDRRAEFLILVGDICLTAARARLAVELVHLDGTCVGGVPTYVLPARGDEELDSTGYGNTIRIEGATIKLEDITRCTVRDT